MLSQNGPAILPAIYAGPVSLHPHQHLMFDVVIFILAIQMHV